MWSVSYSSHKIITSVRFVITTISRFRPPLKERLPMPVLDGTSTALGGVVGANEGCVAKTLVV
jgi:hypothetical protein